MSNIEGLPRTPVRERQEAPLEPKVNSDFAIPINKLKAVTAAKEHVEELFSIRLEYGLQSKDAYSQMQWLVLEGTPTDLAKAKEYLKALCHPEMKQTIDIPANYEDQLKDPEVYNNIEIQSGAIIRFLPNYKVEISGSPTGVFLAQSAIEDKLVNMMTINLAEDSDSDEDDDVSPLPSASAFQRQTSERLNNVLMSVCNQDDTIEMDEEELTSIMMAPNHVKRALIGTLREPLEFDSEVTVRDVSLCRPGDWCDSPESSFGHLATRVRPDSPPDSVIDLKKGLHISMVDQEQQSQTSNQRVGSLISASRDQSSDTVNRHSPQHALAVNAGSSYRWDPLSLHRFADSETLDSLNIPDILDHRNIRKGSHTLANLERIHRITSTPTRNLEDQQHSIDDAETPEHGSFVTPEPCDTPIVIDDTFTEPETIVVDQAEALTEDRLRQIGKDEGFALEDITVALQQFPPDASITKNQFLEALKAQLMLKNAIEEDLRKTIEEERKEEERRNQEQKEDVIMADDGQDGAAQRVEEEVDFGGAWTPVRPKTSGRSPRKGKKKHKARPPAQQIRGATNQPAVQTQDVAGAQVGAVQEELLESPGRSPVQKKPRVAAQQHQLVVPLVAKENQLPKKSWKSKKSSFLRPIVIDGSNVAMSHGEQMGGTKLFSCRGLRIAVEYFKQRGHSDVTVFIPRWREENVTKNNNILDRHILRELQQERHLVYTPSRKLTTGRSIAAYDDRYVIRLAAETGGIIVSNDYFRDLHREVREWRDIIDTRVLMYSFVGDRFMPPDDPLGRYGPTLDEFLRKPQSARNTPAQSPVVPLGASQRTLSQFGAQMPTLSGSQIVAPSTSAPHQPLRFPVQHHQAARWQPEVPVANRFTALANRPPSLLGQPPSLLGQPPRLRVPLSSQCTFRSQTFQSNPPPGGLVSRGNTQLNQFGKDPNVMQRKNQDREELKRKLQEIYPDSDAKIEMVLNKYPNERNANLLCTYMLEEPDIT